MEVALLIWAVALTVLVIVGVVWVLDLQAQLRRLREAQEKRLALATEGDSGLVGIVESLAARLADITSRTDRLTARSEQIEAALARAVRGVGLVRFRAFEDTGGDQSFALALTDGEGNGVVLSALYGRDATRVYAKPVEGWLSPKPLGAEEEQALAQSRQSLLAQR
jgi:hypothetical protein